ncbi:MAG: toprim domain-containing protein, partial [Duncaniella sp.]|nr:toprim domain-containing protein [Duncaniella sp.]
AEGRDIGGSYFRYRGINDVILKKFHRGFAPEGKDSFSKAALERGYSEDYLVETGLTTRTEDGRYFDRFRGRVIYPIFSLSGKPVAFGGRTLKTEKTIAKYVNSPESDIYSKRRELYGLFQAKGAITKADKVYMVEGYMDVLSMAQAGIENVVASSGTALTVEQVRLLKRFAKKVTLIYDSDTAGIKASVRGIDILLKEGLDIKVLLLPEGEDPDSFAQKHPATEVEAYIAAHEQDFVTFIAGLRINEIKNDPVARAEAVTHIVKTIALIPDEIRRSIYVQECSRLMGMSEQILQREVGKYFNQYAQNEREERQRQQQRQQLRTEAPASPAVATVPDDIPPDFIPEEAYVDTPPTVRTPASSPEERRRALLRPAEEELMRLVVRYANFPFVNEVDEEGNTTPLTVIRFITEELSADNIYLSNPDLSLLLETAVATSSATFESDRRAESERLGKIRSEQIDKGIEEIRASASDINSIRSKEEMLLAAADAAYEEGINDFDTLYVSKRLCSSPDDTVRRLATDFTVEQHQLSKMHTKYARIETERDQLPDLLPRMIHVLKDTIISVRIADLRDQIKECASDVERVYSLMRAMREMELQRSSLAKLLGDRVISPRR